MRPESGLLLVVLHFLELSVDSIVCRLGIGSIRRLLCAGFASRSLQRNQQHALPSHTKGYCHLEQRRRAATTFALRLQCCWPLQAALNTYLSVWQAIIIKIHQIKIHQINSFLPKILEHFANEIN